MARFTILIIVFLLCYLSTFLSEIQGKLTGFEKSPLLRQKRTSQSIPPPPPTLRSVTGKLLFLTGSMIATGYAGIQFKNAMNRDKYYAKLEEKRRKSQEQEQKKPEPAHCVSNRLYYFGGDCSPKPKSQAQGIKRTQSWEEKQQEERSQLALARKEPMKVKRTQSMTNLRVEVGQQQQQNTNSPSPNTPPKMVQGLGQIGQLFMRNAAQSSKMRSEQLRQLQEQEGKKSGN